MPGTPKSSKEDSEADGVLPAILPLTEDFMFRGSFGVEECLASLAAFLRAACPWLAAEEFGEITLPDTHRKRRHKFDKECVLDVHVRLKSGRMIAIEVQVVPIPGLLNRGQLVNAKMMVETLRKGGAYTELPQVITIYILGRKLFKGSPEYRHEYRILNVKSKEELPNSQVYLFFELPDVPSVSDGSAEWIWLRLFGARTPEELDALVEKEPAMQAVATKVLEMSGDERMRRLAFSRELWRRDQEAFLHEARTAHDRGLAEGEAKGRAKGRAEGKAEGKAEIARQLLKMKMPLVDIVIATGLSENEIRRLSLD